MSQLPDQKPGLFPETRWTLVLAARNDPARRRRALEELVRPRWRPLYILARKYGLAATAAEDAVQSFLARLLEGDLLQRLDPGKGKLRAYLKTAFKHHLENVREMERAAKRGGGVAHAELQELENLLRSPAPSAEELFDRTWASELFREALADLEREYKSGERSGPFEVLSELFGFGSTKPYAELAEIHGMSVPQLKAFVHRARLRFRKLLETRVANTLPEGANVEEELAELLKVMTT
jgi:RNA polymerase sigma-70 factor (ECF subfamily)